MQRSRVECRNTGYDRVRQEYGQLRSAKNHSVNLLGVSKALDYLHHSLSGLVAEIALEHLAYVPLVNPGALPIVWRHHFHRVTREGLRIKRSFHREPRPEQTQSVQTA